MSFYYVYDGSIRRVSYDDAINYAESLSNDCINDVDAAVSIISRQGDPESECYCFSLHEAFGIAFQGDAINAICWSKSASDFESEEEFLSWLGNLATSEKDEDKITLLEEVGCFDFAKEDFAQFDDEDKVEFEEFRRFISTFVKGEL